MTRVCLLVSVVLQDQLFQEQEGPLVVDLLSDLHTSLPRVLGSEPSTLGTLRTLYDQHEDKCLLEDCAREDLLLDDDFEFESTGVGLGPEEGSVDEPDP